MKSQINNSILYEAKNDWYIVNNNKKVWNKNKVAKFWTTLREFINKKNKIYFENIIFPEFEPNFVGMEYQEKRNFNFWNEKENIEFFKFVQFDNCTFIDKADFYKVHFHSKLCFSNCTFESGIKISLCRINDFEFERNDVKEKFSLYHTTILGNSIFYLNNLDCFSEFSLVVFERKLIIKHCEFIKKTKFFRCKIFNLFSIYHNLFLSELHVSYSIFNSIEYFQVHIDQNFSFIKNIVIKGLRFDSIYFNLNSNVIIDEILNSNSEEFDVKQLALLQSIQEEVQFEESFINEFKDGIQELNSKPFNKYEYLFELIKDFRKHEALLDLANYSNEEIFNIVAQMINEKYFQGIPKCEFLNIIFTKNSRIRNLKLQKTEFFKSDISSVYFQDCAFQIDNNRLLLFDESISEKSNLLKYDRIHKHKELETLYRQLKQSFERDKFWDFMDKSYVSEMKMREKQLNKFSLMRLMYRMYSIFAGYTQDFIKPFLWYMFFTVLFFPTLYHFIQNDYLIKGTQHSSFEVFRLLKLSFAASMPLISTDFEYPSWWVKSIQIIISTVLITFFVLAIRRKFKF